MLQEAIRAGGFFMDLLGEMSVFHRIPSHTMYTNHVHTAKPDPEEEEEELSSSDISYDEFSDALAKFSFSLTPAQQTSMVCMYVAS